MLGLEGEVLKINKLKESVLIKFWGDHYLQGIDEWSRKEVENQIFYLGDNRGSYFSDIPTDHTEPHLNLNLLNDRGAIPVPSWVDSLQGIHHNPPFFL